MKKILSWLVLAGLTIGLLGYFLTVAKIQLGGDIVEYYGVSESLLAHQSVNLSADDQQVLEGVLHKAYFEDPGYYIEGKNDQRYPVHFIFYSFLVTVARLAIKLFGGEELRSLWLVNVLSFSAGLGLIWKWFAKKFSQRITVLALWLCSPLIFFFIWPGPDLWYLSVLSIGVFAYFSRLPLLAGLVTAIASWHSQPLLILSAQFFGMYFFRHSTISYGKIRLNIAVKDLVLAAILAVILFIPFAYNMYAFGVLTPWSILKDGWTTLRGFGLQNASLLKLYEQFFDLNIGIFWYMPALFLAGVAGWLMEFKKDWYVKLTPIIIIITAFFYQTNPGWHYGTSGFGPGRHSLFIIPFLLYFAYQFITKLPKTFRMIVLTLLVISQLPFLAMNRYLEPNLVDTLRHSPVAEYVLDNHPDWYNPTPEIFIDRTNHTDLTVPTSAIYTDAQGNCKKAYVLDHEQELLIQKCDSTPSSVNSPQDTFKQIANYERVVTSPEVTFWPQADACADWFSPTSDHPYVCMKSLDDVMRLTGIDDPNRFTQLEDYPYPGIWKLKYGQPVTVKVPAGYVVDYYALEGTYVNFSE